MEKQPLVSVVVPTYKRPKKLNRAIKSVIKQTYENLEIIVVNDAPTTNIENIINFQDNRIIPINHEKNKGAPAARNTGIKEAKGEFIALLDDDDKWLPQKIEKQVRKFEELDDNYGLIYTWAKIIYKDSTKKMKPRKEGEVYLDFLKGSFIPGLPTTLIKRKVFSQSGMFDEKLKSAQDWEMWIRIAKNYKISFVPKILTIIYQDHSDRISTDLERRYQGGEHVIKKHRSEFEKHPVILHEWYKSKGVLLAKLGADKDICSQYFLNSHIYNKNDLMSLFYLFISKCPKNFRKKIFSFVLEYYRRS